MNKTDLALIDARIELELERLGKLLTLRRQLNKQINTENQDRYSYNTKAALGVLIQQSSDLGATM
ncbi:MAG: hypothetical protein HOD01_12545 [Oceanospirillaceae bacterium]|jgi:hypothetical protein|nr:hypothetical protein [Oceanospirillaceae bacterium]